MVPAVTGAVAPVDRGHEVGGGAQRVRVDERRDVDFRQRCALGPVHRDGARRAAGRR